MISVSSGQEFTQLIRENTISERPYQNDPFNTYDKKYVCSHFTRDTLIFLKSKGYEVYPLRLTASYMPQNDFLWHTMLIVKLDGIWRVLEPQTDQLYSLKEVGSVYGYEYGYIGESIFIGRNGDILEGTKIIPEITSDSFIWFRNV